MSVLSVGDSPSRSGIRSAAVAMVLLTLAACGQDAYVQLKDDKFVEGIITHSDTRNLYVEKDEGGQVALDRDDIVDIDHPGTFLQVAGTLVFLMGVYFVANSHTSSVSTNTIIFSASGAPGLAILGWGTWNNLRSRRAARNLTREKERILDARPYLPAPTDHIPLLPPAGLSDPATK